MSTNPEERSVDSWENAVMFSGENVRSQFLQSVVTWIELVSSLGKGQFESKFNSAFGFGN